MKLSNVLSGLAACVLASASLTGCIIVEDDHIHSGYGSLTVALTIDGRADRFQCFDYDVDELWVSVADEAGFVVAETFADCDDLGLTIDDLPAGYYDVETWLADFDGFQKSDIVLNESVDVHGGTDTIVPVDFAWSWIDP
ncbi:hypothetical protein [Sorangium sp. So ce1335]|uniref:hypothetical protein n=1 Tax=Sorangium sp. So ce1335 TaxID=3133335 RepID=UPI003F5FFAA0